MMCLITINMFGSVKKTAETILFYTGNNLNALLKNVSPSTRGFTDSVTCNEYIAKLEVVFQISEKLKIHYYFFDLNEYKNDHLIKNLRNKIKIISP